MEIVIYGTGANGAEAKRVIDMHYSESVKIMGFLDSYADGEYMGIPILKLEEVNRETIIVIAIKPPRWIAEIYNLLRENGFKNLYWYFAMSRIMEKRQNFLLDECRPTNDWGDCPLPTVELHISDKCNLNCKGCTHFSPLFSDLGASLEDRLEDIKILRSKFTNIIRLDLLGGEPLLNPELNKYVIKMREILPTTFIQIFTNGLLIPRLSEETMRCIKENKLTFCISEYEPTHRIMDKITNVLDRHKIDYIVLKNDIRTMFNKPISVSENTKYPQQCISNGCILVSEGKIARCPTLMYIDKFNERFGQSLPSDGIMDLRSCPSGQQLLDKLQEEVPLCKHCIKCDMPWEVCGKEISIEDFAVLD